MFFEFKNEITSLCSDIFIQTVGRVSDKNPTDITPAGEFIIILSKILLSNFSKVGHLVYGVLSICGK